MLSLGLTPHWSTMLLLLSLGVLSRVGADDDTDVRDSFVRE